MLSEVLRPQTTPPLRNSDDLQVLIVDDSPETARALATLLKRADYVPAVCHRGMEAIEYARQHRCAAAVVDVHLPDMNGLLVAQKLRESFGPRDTDRRAQRRHVDVRPELAAARRRNLLLQ